MTDKPHAERIARLFHETYERLASEFNYETRKASAVPWEQVPDNNKRLMVAVAAEVAAALPTPPAEASAREVLAALRDIGVSVGEYEGEPNYLAQQLLERFVIVPRGDNHG
jgi:hypothetical protein